MTVAELLARISSAELTEWIAFSYLEPFGSEAYYIGHAITASTYANMNRKKGTKPLPLSEFLPGFKKEKQTTSEMLNIAQMYAAAFGSKDE